jgi:hypothetical protein
VERSRRLIRPPAAGEVWYAKLHATACSAVLDTVEVLELTECTVRLRVLTDEFGMKEHTSRYKLGDIELVEFVRELPRAVENVSCPTPLKATVPQWERQRQAFQKPADPNPPPPPTSR